MAWGCMSSKGVGRLVFIDGTMTAIGYVRILTENLEASIEKLGLGDSLIYQHDNDPKHTARITKCFFESNNINVMGWSSQSPDINSIEHLWAHIKFELKKYQPKNLKELKEKIMDIWNGISEDLCKRLVHGIPKRCETFILAKGYHIPY
jgi:hypothetical protein